MLASVSMRTQRRHWAFTWWDDGDDVDQGDDGGDCDFGDDGGNGYNDNDYDDVGDYEDDDEDEVRI